MEVEVINMKYWSNRLGFIDDIDQFPYKLDDIIYSVLVPNGQKKSANVHYHSRIQFPIKNLDIVVKNYNYTKIYDCNTRLTKLNEDVFKAYPQHYYKTWIIFQSKSDQIKWKLKT